MFRSRILREKSNLSILIKVGENTFPSLNEKLNRSFKSSNKPNSNPFPVAQVCVSSKTPKFIHCMNFVYLRYSKRKIRMKSCYVVNTQIISVPKINAFKLFNVIA